MNNNQKNSRLSKLIGFALSFFIAFAISKGVPAAPPPTGTVLSNTASSSQQIGGLPQTTTSNVVTATVGAAAGSPTLRKSFGVESINPGETATIRFSLFNTVGSPAQAGIAFTDTLPAGLRLTAAPTVTRSPGCVGTVTFTQPSTISVSNASMAPGTQVCDIAVSGVTNAPSQTNATCAGNPAAFTNGPASITGIANILNAVTNQCLVIVAPIIVPTTYDLFFSKSISAIQGNSPSGAYRVVIRYGNASIADAVKTNVTISDVLPAGMTYVPGTLRLAAPPQTNDASLNAASGPFMFNGLTGTYTTSSDRISVNFATMRQNESGLVSFDVNIAPGLALNSVLTNIAENSYTGIDGTRIGPRTSNPVDFRITGTENITLRGVTLPSVDPGSTVTFNNVLTNNTSKTDSFDVTLSGSNFPPDTIFQLFKPDGVTPLTDTNGNAIPDTGPVAAGATYRIVVKAILPPGIAGGPFRVSKNAQSISNPLIRAIDDDVVTSIANLCRVVLEPDNTGRTTPGGNVVYTHVLTNVGTCNETITLPANFLVNGSANWLAQIVVDNPVAGGQSIVGVFDATDVVVAPNSTFTLPPGARIVFLNRVVAPTNAASGASNTTDFRVNTTSSGTLTNRDTTTIGTTITVENIIQGFIDGSFQRATPWAFIGRDLFLRANAPSCNQLPDVIERRTIIITGANGEREEIIAVETGPNTGIFEASGLPVRKPPVIAGNNILEGNSYDTYSVEIIGCGRRIATSVTVIDPNGVVFDSRTNEPVAGATVRLVTAQGGVCTSTPATVSQLVNGSIVASPATVVTRADGRFDFPLVSPGDYCALVTPPNGYTFASIVPVNQLPPGRNVLATGPTTGGSYGGVFRVGPDTGPVIIDIPVDAGRIGGLFVQKTVSRSTVEIGDLTDYAITINNNTGYALNQSPVLLTDSLPAGFSFVPGTARLEGKPLADPQISAGSRLIFNVGNMAVAQQLRLTYRVRVGPGATQGDGINRVVASYRVGNGSTRFSESNVAAAQVTIVGGVFSDKAYVVGKIFIDCDKNGVQNLPAESDADKKKLAREVGVPGVRLYLEDGTNVVSDSEGKYSFYGLSARTHVLKIDRTTLPAGIDVKDFAADSNRNAGKGDSRFLDLKYGELHKADFAIQSCSESVVNQVASRRAEANKLKTEIDGRLQQQLTTDPANKFATDIKALPASGVVGLTAPSSVAPTPSAASILPSGANTLPNAATLGTVGFATIAPAQPPLSRAIVERIPGAPVVILENILPQENNMLGFIGMKDGDTLAYKQTTIRVKGVQGTTFKLSVNGKDLADDRVGKKAVMEDKKLQAWEFIGADLVPGVNTLTVKQIDTFGNERGEATIKVTAPGNISKLLIEFPQATSAGARADGKTPITVIVRVVDNKGVAVTSRTAVTLLTNVGRWQVEDLNAAEPGIQNFVQGGVGEFTLLPPTEPGQAVINARSGSLSAEARLDFLPDVRELLAVGVIEGVLNLRKLDTRALTPARTQDGFEQEITHISRNWNDGKYDAGARAAMFIKGKIKGEYLLTLAYDSDKNTRERLFRDIQPDEFYPVYGDSSVRAFDAQSTGRFYVRVDNKKSYLLYGDYNTTSASEARKLANYNRSLTGLKQHFENDKISANIFASRDTTRQLLQEFKANGTSGPFTLANAKGLINSEKVEIITRDRNQTGVIIRTVPLARFADYELEPLTGRIILKAPVPTLDELFNPNSIRVTYEVDQGGEQFWVAGADAQIKLTDNFEVGAMVVDDRNPVDKFRMIGINAIAKLADKTFLIAEIAQTTRDRVGNGIAGGLSGGSGTIDDTKGEKKGIASRIEFRHKGDDIDALFYAGRADAKFDNISSSLSSGRTEIGGNVGYRIDEKTRLKAEMLRSEDLLSNGKRDGLLAAVERTLDNGMRVELGVRHARETQAPATTQSGPLLTEVTSIRTRLTGDIPGVKDAAAYVEAEVDPKDTDRKIAAIGGEYKLPNNGRLYGRHEFISSLTGPYGLNTVQRQNSSVIGISTDYMKDGNVFSEYRIRDAISGGDAEAAVGLRNLWTLSDGLKLQTGFERVHSFSGTGTGESAALTFGLEYTASPLWKGSTRLELRDGASSDSLLSTVAIASKINREWTFLGRNTYSLIKNQGVQTPSGKNEQERFQVGVAYRDTETDVWNGLARVEHRSENDTTQPELQLKRTVELFSLHANWQPRRPFTFSGRYAAKWVNEDSNGIKAKNNAHLLSARAIWEIAPRWDISVTGSTVIGRGAQSKTYAVGLELGFMVMESLWLSGGYNFYGYRDEDFANGEYTNKGTYLRLRYKFDEDLFQSKTKETEPTKKAVADVTPSAMNKVADCTAAAKSKKSANDTAALINLANLASPASATIAKTDATSLVANAVKAAAACDGSDEKAEKALP
jgi:large repetitive protein